jgi:hypothetical protein
MRRLTRQNLPLVLALLFSCGAASTLSAQQRFSFEVFGGSAYNVPTPLTVEQTGFPDIRVGAARYDTKPLGPYYPYYSWRAMIWNREGTAAWEATQVHHRLFLTNKPPEIQTFEIHFGYNFYMLGRAWKRGDFVYHLDGGVLICNPTNTVRNQKLSTRDQGLFDAGYYLSGIGGQFGVSRSVELMPQLDLVGNGAVIIGRARVPVVDGTATVPNVGFHGQIGLAIRF